jgi:hypothetical protein
MRSFSPQQLRHSGRDFGNFPEYGLFRSPVPPVTITTACFPKTDQASPHQTKGATIKEIMP